MAGLGLLVALQTSTKYNSDKVLVQAIAIEPKPDSEGNYILSLLSEIEVTNRLGDIVATTYLNYFCNGGGQAAACNDSYWRAVDGGVGKL